MLLLQHDVHNYYIYMQCWLDQMQFVVQFVTAPISIECLTLVENQLIILQLFHLGARLLMHTNMKSTPCE